MPIDDLFAYFAAWNGRGAEGAANLVFERGRMLGRYAGMCLSSVYQPLFSAATLQPVAHEALLRAEDGAGASIAPAQAFAAAVTAEDAMFFDRLCRVVHACNFAEQSGGQGDLYLNVSGRHLLGVGEGHHGRTFERLLKHSGLRPERVVLEIIESGVDDLQHLQQAVEAYRSHGFRLAIDDFGSQHSNFDRLWQLTPDIVKIDRSLLLEATGNPRARRILPKLIEIIHDLGAQVVCEGAETAEQHRLAVDAGADLLQGYYYARPAATLLPMLSGAAGAPRAESA